MLCWTKNNHSNKYGELDFEYEIDDDKVVSWSYPVKNRVVPTELVTLLGKPKFELGDIVKRVDGVYNRQMDDGGWIHGVSDDFEYTIVGIGLGYKLARGRLNRSVDWEYRLTGPTIKEGHVMLALQDKIKISLRCKPNSFKYKETKSC